jgi:hypothetical protein
MIATNGTLWNFLQRVRSIKDKALRVKYNLGFKKHPPSANAQWITATELATNWWIDNVWPVPTAVKSLKRNKWRNTKKKVQNNYYKFQPPKSYWLLISDYDQYPKFQSRTSLHFRSRSDWATAWKTGDRGSVSSRTRDFSLPHRIQTGFGVKPVSSEWIPEGRPDGVAAETLRSSLMSIQCLGYKYVEYTSTPQYTFMALCLILQSATFTFSHTGVTSFVSVTTNDNPGSHSRLLYAVCIIQFHAACHKSCCQYLALCIWMPKQGAATCSSWKGREETHSS